MSYAELHCLSNFSFQRGASHPQELIRRAHELGYSALALTDECSLAGIVRAWEVARELSFKLIVGGEFSVAGVGKLVLLAPDAEGYAQLCALMTLGRRRSSKGRYALLMKDLCNNHGRLLTLWVPEWPEQILPEEDFAQTLEVLKPLFDQRLWIVCERHLHPEDRRRLALLRRLARRYGLPLVAAGDVRYHVHERRALHDVLSCIRAGCTIFDSAAPIHPNGQRHLRPLSTLARLYPADLLRETLVIAERCTFSLDQLRYEYPHELVPTERTAIEHLRNLTEAGCRRRWPQGMTEDVRALIERELRLIEELHYEHFFLTVEDIVRFARSRDILCQGRGSAANSAVCFAMGITEVDPARMNLLFERFLSKERAEPPDIDVDFEHQRREEVIQYLYEKYGRDRAALAATVICYRPRMAIRDVGKALGLSIEQVNAISKSLAWWDGPEALVQRLSAMGLSIDGHRLQTLMRRVNEILGFPRHLSQHVGGFVISQQPLSSLVPIENAAMPDRTIIQWDKEDLEALGLLKVDCLALGMLSALHRALDLVALRRGRPMALADIPAEDAKTYEMIGRGETTGVFQIESRAQMSMLPRLRPAIFFDLVVEVAIIRPGPIQGGMVHPYLRRRQGLENVEYPSDALRKVLEPTLGIPLFQEQVMQIAMVAAGFSPGEADQVRRSMAAWQRKGGLEKFRDKLMSGMLERGYDPVFCEQIYQQVLGFGSYGFPQSHAASFALLTYASCWLKCHEPAAFCAALINSQPMGFYQPAQLVNDARRNGVRFHSPDVSVSDWDCTVVLPPSGDPEVQLGLRMIAGLPEAEAQRTVEARRHSDFKSLQDLARRAQLGKKAIDALADAGALASLVGHRHAARWQAAGVQKLDAVLHRTTIREDPLALPAPTEGQGILADYRSLGLTLGRHPLALLRHRFAKLRVLSNDRLARVESGRQVRVAGIVTHRQRPETASGVVFATIEDETGTANLIIWPKVFDAQRQAVLGAMLMVVSGELQSEQGVIHVVARQVEDYTVWLGSLRVDSRDFH